MEMALASALNPPPMGSLASSRSVGPNSQKTATRSTCIVSRRASSRPCLFVCSSTPNPEKSQLLRKAMVFINTSTENLKKFLPKEVKEFPWKKAEKLQEYLPREVREFSSKKAEELQEYLPREVKEFPWNEARERTTKDLLFLGRESIRWSLAAFLILSPILDVVNAITRKMELLIPLGLFIGVIAAQFLNVISEELIRESNEEWDARTRLLGLGLIIAFIKLGLVLLKPPGQMLFSHACNGGLLQILWLLKNPEETSDDAPKEPANEGTFLPAQ